MMSLVLLRKIFRHFPVSLGPIIPVMFYRRLEVALRATLQPTIKHTFCFWGTFSAAFHLDNVHDCSILFLV